MLRAMVYAIDREGIKSVRDIYESDKFSQINLLRFAKRRLVANPPESRIVKIEVKDISDPTSEKTVHEKRWRVPYVYHG